MAYIPDEALLFVADEDYSVDRLLATLYSAPTPLTGSHFRDVNRHVKNDLVRAGQFVILTPEHPSECAQWEHVMMEAVERAEQEFSALTEGERKRLARHYALMSDLADYSSHFVGWSGTWLTQKTKRIEFVLREVDQLYVEQLKGSGHLSNSRFFENRKNLFRKLDSVLNGALRRQLFTASARSHSIKAALGLSSKAIVHQFKAHGPVTTLPQLQSHYGKLVAMSKAFSTVGYASIGLTVAGGFANFAEACAVQPHGPACIKARYVETGRMAVGIGVGFGAGLAGARVGASVCSILIGPETFGLGIAVCIAAFGGAGAYAGGKGGSVMGGAGGNLLYEKIVTPSQ